MWALLDSIVFVKNLIFSMNLMIAYFTHLRSFFFVSWRILCLWICETSLLWFFPDGIILGIFFSIQRYLHLLLYSLFLSYCRLIFFNIIIRKLQLFLSTINPLFNKTNASLIISLRLILAPLFTLSFPF